MILVRTYAENHVCKNIPDDMVSCFNGPLSYVYESRNCLWQFVKRFYQKGNHHIYSKLTSCNNSYEPKRSESKVVRQPLYNHRIKPKLNINGPLIKPNHRKRQIAGKPIWQALHGQVQKV